MSENFICSAQTRSNWVHFWLLVGFLVVFLGLMWMLLGEGMTGENMILFGSLVVGVVIITACAWRVQRRAQNLSLRVEGEVLTYTHDDGQAKTYQLADMLFYRVRYHYPRNFYKAMYGKTITLYMRDKNKISFIQNDSNFGLLLDYLEAHGVERKTSWW